MTCYQAFTLLEDYVDKELPADKEVLIREHITGCASCREEFETTLLLKELLKGFHDISAVSAVIVTYQAAFRAQHSCGDIGGAHIDTCSDIILLVLGINHSGRRI